MSTIYRVSFLCDMAHVTPGASEEEVKAYIRAKLLVTSRKAVTDRLHEVRKDQTLGMEDKAEQMGQCMRALMLTLMAEANFELEQMPADTVVVTELPFERRHPA